MGLLPFKFLSKFLSSKSVTVWSLVLAIFEYIPGGHHLVKSR